MQSSSNYSITLRKGQGERSFRADSIVSPRNQWRLLTGVLIFNDLFMAALAFRLAYFIRFQINLPIFHLEVKPSQFYYQNVIVLLLGVWLLIFAIMGLYNRQNLLGGTREYSKVFNAATIGMFVVIVAGFLVTDFILARGWVLLAWALTFFLIASGRFLIRRIVYYLRRKGYFLSSALIVGANEESLSLAEQLSGWQTSGLHLLGFIDDKVPAGTTLYQHLTCLGKVADLPVVLEAINVEEIILTTSAFTREQMLPLFKKYGVSKDVNLRLSSGLFEIITTGIEVNEVSNVPLMKVHKARLTGIDSLLKRLLDYSLALPGLIVLSPLMLIIALLVRLDSPGPVLYRRRVMGENGKQFDAFKFRTMRVDGDQILEANPALKVELEQNGKLIDDPRITRLGGLLRKASLDELPQLLNVLHGDMSLVGPRMISPAEMPKYDRWDLNLLTVRPGITGLWQVSGRSDISYDERVRLDMFYIRNWSIWLDLQLLMATIPAVLKGRGAY